MAKPERREAPVPDDAAIIQRSVTEPERFADLFDRHFAEIHGYVSRRLGRGLADDLASETFLIAFDRRDRYDGAYPDARPWLYGIVSNLIARHRRSEARRYRALARAPVPDVLSGDLADDVSNRVDARALSARLAGALAQMPRRDRDVLLLVAWAGLSLEETAGALSIPAGTARSRLHRARRQARQALDQPNTSLLSEEIDS